MYLYSSNYLKEINTKLTLSIIAKILKSYVLVIISLPTITIQLFYYKHSSHQNFQKSSHEDSYILIILRFQLSFHFFSICKNLFYSFDYHFYKSTFTYIHPIILKKHKSNSFDHLMKIHTFLKSYTFISYHFYHEYYIYKNLSFSLSFHFTNTRTYTHPIISKFFRLSSHEDTFPKSHALDYPFISTTNICTHPIIPPPKKKPRNPTLPTIIIISFTPRHTRPNNWQRACHRQFLDRRRR